MHSKIYEILDHSIEMEEWAMESTIGDEYYHINGVDYYSELDNAKERCECIEYFFSRFPYNSFKIIKNAPNKTAVIEFVGDIKLLYQKWMEEIKEAAKRLTIEEMNRLAVYDVRLSCTQPFGIDCMFYQEEWNGCTVEADDFLSMLSYRAEKNNYKPFKLYVGQVFDYHY